MARTAGHEVLFASPHHSDLQPIELVWEIVKGEVSRQYTTDTTIADVKHRLGQAFDRLSDGEVARWRAVSARPTPFSSNLPSTSASQTHFTATQRTANRPEVRSATNTRKHT
ncbi:hypothetical protein PybrP1_011747 [[Pythium] brassicae (nom. inval.)]|nr:hypothetical protein PybrP1_011747 [[Pythium] brassicae (nom. inval.)]